MSENNTPTTKEEVLDISEILQIRRDKLTALKNENKDPFVVTKVAKDTNSKEINDRFLELENKTVTIAGRIMSWRDMGKASFIDIRDREGRMQVYLKIDDLGEDVYNDFKKVGYWRPCCNYRLCFSYQTRRNFGACTKG